MGKGSRPTGNPVNGRVGLAVDALRDELGISITDLAERIDTDAAQLYAALNGDTAGHRHLTDSVRALADVMEFQSVAVAHSA